MRTAVLLLLLCAGAGILAAQTTAAEIETIMASPAVTYAQAARFTLEAAEVTVIANAADAFTYAADRNWLPKKAKPGDTARLNGISLLLMEAFNLKGGWFYTMLKTPHYAYRELVYLGVIQGRTDPHMAVSGDDFLYLISRILSIKEAQLLEPERVRTQGIARIPDNARGRNILAADLAVMEEAWEEQRRIRQAGITIQYTGRSA